MDFKTSYAKKKGFNEDLITYAVVGPDTYSIKDKLKSAGFMFEKTIGWHSPIKRDVPEGYSLYPLQFDECYDSDYEAIESVKWKLRRLNKGEPAEGSPKYPKSSFVGGLGERLRNLPVKLLGVKKCSATAYGVSMCCLFESGDNVLQWFTTSSAYLDYEVGDSLLLSGTVKEHNGTYYGGSAVTTLTRCLLKPIS